MAFSKTAINLAFSAQGNATSLAPTVSPSPNTTFTIKPPLNPTIHDFQFLIVLGVIYATVILLSAIVYMCSHFQKLYKTRKRWAELQNDNISLRSLRTSETANAIL